MLDDIIEVVLELVLDGAIEAAGSKKVPMPIRILAAGIVLVIALGLIGPLFWVGVDSNSTGLVTLAVVLLVVFSGWVFFAVRRHNRRVSK